jgi:hypothetical protein
VWQTNIEFEKLDTAEPLPIGGAGIISDNIGFTRAAQRQQG